MLPENEIKTSHDAEHSLTVVRGISLLMKKFKSNLTCRSSSDDLSKMADETVMEVDVVGPIEVRFENKRTIVDAVVLPGTSEVLLGAYPLEGLDVMIDPKRRTASCKSSLAQ